MIILSYEIIRNFSSTREKDLLELEIGNYCILFFVFTFNLF